MRSSDSVVFAALATLAVVSLSLGIAGGAAGGATMDGIEANSTDDIRLRNAPFLTDDRGTVGVTTTAIVPDRVSELRLTLRTANEAPIDANGFERDEDDGNTVWVWDGDTERPSLTYAMDANVTADPEGPLAESGQYRFVDVGEWAIVRTPRLHVAWRGPEGIGVEHENTVDGPGVASEAMAFLGPHEEHVYESGGQRFRLIVPDAADPVESPEAVFETLDYAATALQVGARDDEMIAIIAPTESVDWSARGLQIGDTDLWVLDDEPIGTVDDVWTHEYVHTRQSYEADESARWFTEASATYYAALFAVERGDADFEEFQRALASGQREPDSSAILANPETWSGSTAYNKGALVAGEIDRQLRIETDGKASLATVFRDLNEASEPVTIGTFLDAVEAAAAEGGDEEAAAAIRADAERFTTTDEVPELWDREAHETAFGETPAQVGYGISEDGARATGEYRDRPVDRDPVRLVEGETLAATLAIHNTGGVAGDYEVTMAVDGEPVGTRTGTLESGSETTERFEHAFAETGEYEVRLGSETLAVVVSEPADVTVRDVAVSSESVAVGESVDVTAILANDAGIPAGSTVDVRVNGESIGSEPVRLDAGEETTMERQLALDEPGSATIAVVAPSDEALTAVDVEGNGLFGGSGDDEDGTIGETVGDVPGFGPTVAALAVLSVVVLLRGRRAE